MYMPAKTMPETVNIYSNQHTLRDSPKKGQDLTPHQAAVVTERPPPAAVKEPKRPAPVETTTKKEVPKQVGTSCLHLVPSRKFAIIPF